MVRDKLGQRRWIVRVLATHMVVVLGAGGLAGDEEATDPAKVISGAFSYLDSQDPGN